MTGNGGSDGEEGEEEGGPGGDVGGEQVVDVDPTLESENEEIVNLKVKVEKVKSETGEAKGRHGATLKSSKM